MTKGFTLIEIMVAVLIIGIFSALAIPGILELRHRNALADSVERVRSAAQMTRDLAMKTRSAVVLEVRAENLWINILEGPACGSDIARRCTSPAANASGLIPVFESGDTGPGASAGVALCGGVARSVAAEDPEDPASAAACNGATDLAVIGEGGGFGLCYSGRGELFFRPSADDETACEATEQPDSAWARACSGDPETTLDDVAFADDATAPLTDGVVLMLNRYSDDTPCSSEKITDVMRLVRLPTSGAPFSELPI